MSDIIEDTGDISNFQPPLSGTPRLITFLRSAIQNPEHDELFQEVLNLGYEEWQRPEHEGWDFSDMIEWMRENFGDEAALLVMLGKFNQQVTNGGIIQWLDNGYASEGRSGRYRGVTPEMDITLLEEMLITLEESKLASLPHGIDIIQILRNIQNVFEDSSGECYTCRNHRYVQCDVCGGNGKADDEDICEACEGEGEVDGEPCEVCDGEGYVESEDDCDECGGEGEVPCPDCNEDGQLDTDSQEAYLPNGVFDHLNRLYYKINEEWVKEIQLYLRSLVRSQPTGGLLSRAQAIRATENLLKVVDRLIEVTESDMNRFPKPPLHWEDMSYLIELLFGGIPDTDISEDVFNFWNCDGEIDETLAVLNSGYDVAKELLASPGFYKFMTSRLNSYKAALLKIKNKYPSDIGDDEIEDDEELDDEDYDEDNLLDDLDLLLESIIEDEDTEGDVSMFESPSDRKYLLVTLDRERGANDRYDYEVKAPNDEYALKYAIVQLLSLYPETMDPSTQDLLKLEQEHPGIFDDPDDNEMLADWGMFVVSLTNMDTGEVIYSTDRDFEFNEEDID